MSKERYNQIIDEAYENYSKEYEKDNSIGMCLLVARMDGKSTYRKPDKEMFIGLCTHDETFSEKWGLKIEERELSNVERQILLEQKGSVYQGVLVSKAKNYKSHKKIIESIKETCDEFDIPTRQITLTYNGTKIEIYE